MDLRKLKTLIDLVAESGISELEVTEENDKVQTVAVAAPVAAPVVAAPAPALLLLPLNRKLRPKNPQSKARR